MYCRGSHHGFPINKNKNNTHLKDHPRNIPVMFAVKLFSTRVVSDKNNLKIFFSIGGFGFMVFNATLNNISVISWQFSIGSNVKVALCWLLFWISDQHKKNFCKGPYHPMISQMLSLNFVFNFFLTVKQKLEIYFSSFLH